jgi:hypothetical protein
MRAIPADLVRCLGSVRAVPMETIVAHD